MPGLTQGYSSGAMITIIAALSPSHSRLVRRRAEAGKNKVWSPVNYSPSQEGAAWERQCDGGGRRQSRGPNFLWCRHHAITPGTGCNSLWRSGGRETAEVGLHVRHTDRELFGRDRESDRRVLTATESDQNRYIHDPSLLPRSRVAHSNTCPPATTCHIMSVRMNL